MKRALVYITLMGLIAWVSPTAPVSATTDAFVAQVDISEDATPEERVTKKKELARSALTKANEKAVDMGKDLEALEFEGESAETTLRESFLSQVESYAQFYEAKLVELETLVALAEVDTLIDEVIDYRESTYAPTAKEILEFILVFSYTPSVLEVANERFDNIKSDVERLEGLEVIEAGGLAPLIDQASTTLAESRGLHTQAVSDLTAFYSEEGAGIAKTPSPRELAEESLNKVRGLYDLFIEIGQRVEEALGIEPAEEVTESSGDDTVESNES